jgi:hypothetical protein
VVDDPSKDEDFQGQISGAVESKVGSKQRSFDAKISRVAYDGESWAGQQLCLMKYAGRSSEEVE